MSVISYKCPNCDGDLRFDPASQKYKCEYCFSMFSQEELEAMNPDKEEEKEKQQKEKDASTDTANDAQDRDMDPVLYTCPSCGAEIVTDSTTAATFCYYCHNPVVLSGRLSGDYLPDKVIPFTIDKAAATSKFLEYVGKKKFVPKAFFNKKQIESITGVYFPYWMYDCKMEGSLQAEATNVRVWVAGEEEYTETKFYDVLRQGNVSLKNLTKEALKKANRVLIEGILPYDFNAVQPFSMGFLSGFLAEKRDVEKEELSGAINDEIAEYGKNLLRETVGGYNGVKIRNCGFHNKEEQYTYALLPVWTVTYKGKDGKIYYYSMNGQTGKICGELPIAHGKIALTAIIAGVAAFLITLIGGYFL